MAIPGKLYKKLQVYNKILSILEPHVGWKTYIFLYTEKGLSLVLL